MAAIPTPIYHKYLNDAPTVATVWILITLHIKGNRFLKTRGCCWNTQEQWDLYAACLTNGFIITELSSTAAKKDKKQIIVIYDYLHRAICTNLMDKHDKELFFSQQNTNNYQWAVSKAQKSQHKCGQAAGCQRRPNVSYIWEQDIHSGTITKFSAVWQ